VVQPHLLRGSFWLAGFSGKQVFENGHAVKWIEQLIFPELFMFITRLSLLQRQLRLRTFLHEIAQAIYQSLRLST
jgi:hypothetical protein